MLKFYEFFRAMEGFVPSVLTRYRQQILFPVLRLCLSLLTSFGSGSQLAASQVNKGKMLLCRKQPIFSFGVSLVLISGYSY